MSSLVSPGIETLRPYAAGKPIEEVTRELGIADVIKLASNENPLGPSPKALEAAAAALSGAHRYPDASAHALRTELRRAAPLTLQGLKNPPGIIPNVKSPCKIPKGKPPMENL